MVQQYEQMKEARKVAIMNVVSIILFRSTICAATLGAKRYSRYTLCRVSYGVDVYLYGGRQKFRKLLLIKGNCINCVHK
jgi:hypothetical protein